MSRAELVEFAEKEADCFCFHCICDAPHPEHSPVLGIKTKYFIPRAKDRDNFEGGFFTAMSRGRLEIETAEEGKAFVVDLPGLGWVREKAGKLRKFLRRWEDSKCREERRRLNYSNHFPALGRIAEIPEVEVIHSEACKLKAAREQYEKAWEDYNEALKQAFTASDSETVEPPAPPSLKDPTGEPHRDSVDPLTEQIIGRLVISKMSKNDGKFFDLLSKMAKNLEIKQTKNVMPEAATDRKRRRKKQILIVASKLIQKTHRLPSKAGLMKETDALFSEEMILDEREFRRNLKALGLSGLPGGE